MSEDIIGKKFGRLTVLEEFSKNGRKYCKCLCDCGNECQIRKDCVKKGKIKSCGCLKKIKHKLDNGRYRKLVSNTIEEKENYIIIKIESKGQTYDCLIDKEDYPKVKDFRWSLKGKNSFYIESNSYGKKILLHRIVLNAREKQYIDHINHNPLDNRKCNLRICTNQQNSFNKKSKGYYWNKNSKKWQAQISIDKTWINLGKYNTEFEAKEARRKAEEKYFGEFRYKGGDA